VFENQVPTIQPGDVATRVADGWMLLDVRTDDEWAGGRIASSVHIPMDQLMQRMDELDDQPLSASAPSVPALPESPSSSTQGREAVNLDGGLCTRGEGSGRPVEA
jgi:rhodanese-related sulfurtransferase